MTEEITSKNNFRSRKRNGTVGQRHMKQQPFLGAYELQIWAKQIFGLCFDYMDLHIGKGNILQGRGYTGDIDRLRKDNGIGH